MTKLATIAVDDRQPEIVRVDALPLWASDDELAPLVGLPRDTFRQVAMMYDADPKSGFPKRIAIYGNRRYVPAVLDFWETIYRPKIRAFGGTKP